MLQKKVQALILPGAGRLSVITLAACIKLLIEFTFDFFSCLTSVLSKSTSAFRASNSAVKLEAKDSHSPLLLAAGAGVNGRGGESMSKRSPSMESSCSIVRNLGG